MEDAASGLIVGRMAGRLIEKQVGGMGFVGVSVAGVETVVAIPELNVCFDAGRAPTEMITIDNLCLTHGHMDHAAGLAYYLSQRGFIAYGDKLRSDIFRNTLQSWARQSKPATAEEIADLGIMLNVLTGRGNLPPELAKNLSFANGYVGAVVSRRLED